MNPSALDPILPRRDVREIFDWDNRQELGQGAFAAVVAARRRSDGRRAAVKCVAKARLQTGHHWQQLAHEVVLSSYLDHPGCVRCRDAFQDESHVYLVLDLVPGGDLLRAILDRRGDFTEAVVAGLTRQILEAVAFLHHEKGITHRDLKPENLLLSSADLPAATVKVTDFGFAKFFGRPEDMSPHFGSQLRALAPAADAPKGPPLLQSPGGTHTPSTAGAVVHTPKGSVRYLAPEIIRHLNAHGFKPRVTTRPEIQKVDIYAVGVVVYVMFCGRFPYKGDKADVIQRSMETHPLAFPRDVPCAGAVSEAAKDFCRWLLAPDPTARPLALQALRHPWLTCPTPDAPTTAHGPGSFLEALLALEADDVETLRRQDSEEDRTNGHEPSAEALASIFQPPGCDLALATPTDSPVIPVRAVASGVQLNVSKIPKRSQRRAS